MEIQYVQGDLFESPERYLIHGVNASKKFGSGVAGQIKQRYPVATQGYFDAFLNGTPKLGTIVFCSEPDRTIIHAFTQATCGYDVAQYVDYEAVRKAMDNLNSYFAVFRWMHREPVAMPKIGAGLGGGDWDAIAEIIEDESKNFQPVVYYL